MIQAKIIPSEECNRSPMDVNYYNAVRGIWSPLIEHGDIITGYWMPGNNYQKDNDYYGGYPRDYLERMRALFPHAVNVLHLFSGMVVIGRWPHEERVDINLELPAEHHYNAEQIAALDKFRKWELILADPPYEENHEKYSTEKANKKKVVHGCASVIRPGGFLVWLDTRIPIWAKSDGWKLRGTIGLVQSTNCLTKTTTILEKARDCRTSRKDHETPRNKMHLKGERKRTR